MGGKNNKAPKPPNYAPIAEASKESAQYSYALGREQLEWAREQDYYDRQIADAVIGSALERQYINDQAAMADRARYEEIYQPLEDSQVREAYSYASPGRREYEMGRASSEVAQQMEGARRNARQQLESFGIDPSATRYAALDLGSRVQQAAAQAGAANQAGVQTEAVGRALRSESINVGRGYPGQIAGTYGTALQSGNQAVNSTLATTASGANTMGTAPQWQGMGNQALGVWGNTLNMGYQNQLAQWQANQQNSSGIGSILGGALGMATMFLEDGGNVPEEAITSGGNLGEHLSPSRGAAIDDIPARVAGTNQAVQLNADEFVVPEDVAKWKGEEFFQKLIIQSRKAKQEAPAKPTMGPPAQPPVSALPV